MPVQLVTTSALTCAKQLMLDKFTVNWWANAGERKSVRVETDNGTVAWQLRRHKTNHPLDVPCWSLTICHRPWDTWIISWILSEVGLTIPRRVSSRTPRYVIIIIIIIIIREGTRKGRMVYANPKHEGHNSTPKPTKTVHKGEGKCITQN